MLLFLLSFLLFFEFICGEFVVEGPVPLAGIWIHPLAEIWIQLLAF